MRTVRVVSMLLSACLVGAGLAARPASGVSVTPTLVAIRAAHHPGFDRIVFRFDHGLPANRDVRYVDRLVGDASGLPVRIAGRAVLQVRFRDAVAHDASGATVTGRKAFPLPNVMTAVRSGDFEAVTTYGVGLAKRTPFHVFTLSNPDRVVIDVRAAFPTVDRKVYFFDEDSFMANQEPFFRPVLRPVRPQTPATGVLDRLFAGPVAAERRTGLRLLRSHATGYADLAVTDRVARVRLTGGCGSDGSTVTVAGELMPTLHALVGIDWVKILDPAGTTEVPTGPADSIPVCLEP